MAVRVPWYSTLENDPQSSPDSNSTVWTIDFRETTPAAGNSTMFGDDPFKSLFGGLSVGVPGEIRGLAEAHARWGRLPWKQLVMPSAHIARGWRVGKELDKRLKWLGSFMHHSRDWAPIFAPTGHLLTEGELIKRTTYAHTLSIIAKEGPDAFYSSSSKIARAIVRKVQSEGGIMTQEDLEGYKPVVEQALEGSYRGKKIWVTGAPSSGPVLLHILNLLELFDLSEGPTPLNIHRIVEAMKFGFAARTRISDPVSNADIKRMADIHTKEYAKEIFPRITDNITHTPDYYNPVFDVPTDHGTTHLSVVDKDGMAVSITSTINLVWGSRVLDQATGIIFNDELDDFSRPGMPNAFGLPPSPYNYASPNKRPLSSTSPVIMETASGEFYAALGGSGGSRIFGAVLQVILNLEWGMDASKAVEEPRVHDQLYPLETSVESGFNEATMESLKAKGHNITVFDINLGVAEVQAVVKDPKTGEFSAASDSRKNGIADAF
ncbi:hypothetical protein FRC03_009145 [Tulasnella sp. 419]|nr:hypothetical protein FRC03_009145 [Tulasnella sp. 419]